MTSTLNKYKHGLVVYLDNVDVFCMLLEQEPTDADMDKINYKLSTNPKLRSMTRPAKYSIMSICPAGRKEVASAIAAGGRCARRPEGSKETRWKAADRRRRQRKGEAPSFGRRPLRFGKRGAVGE